MKSINWINTLKAFCIMAVFICHTQVYYGRSIEGLGAFVNPWFVYC